MGRSLIRYRLHQSNGHWDPRKYHAKSKALRSFCGTYGIVDDELIASLAAFQCSGFVRAQEYRVLRRYAQNASDLKSPKLGWIDEALLREPSYSDFLLWLRKAQERVVGKPNVFSRAGSDRQAGARRAG
jgi:hypothetical protein